MPATAADLPPELFPYILIFLYFDARVNENVLSRDPESLTCLRNCSLVCITWANWCRELMFRASKIRIKSLEDLETLERYYMHGCPRLAPIKSWVTINAQQSFNEPSWCYRLHASPLLRDDRNTLTLCDLSPGGRLPASPFWSLPRSLPVKFLPFNHVALTDMHLPSLAALSRVTSHFAHVMSFTFRRVTWAASDADSVVPAQSRKSARSDAVQFSTSACTDGALLCLHFLQSRRMPRWLPLREPDRQALLAMYAEMSNPERVQQAHKDVKHIENWMSKGLQWSSKVHYKDPFVQAANTIIAGVQILHTASGLRYFPHFVLFLSLGIRMSHITTLRLLIPADPPDDAVNAVNAFLIDLLHAAVPSIPDLTHVEVVADAYKMLTSLLDYKPTLRVRPIGIPERVIYRWGCYRSDKQPLTDVPQRDVEFGDVVDIDIATSKPTGQCWK